ncbi:receptor-type tyrosine-protein phosphatase H isoform X3 [Procambarus clarkii]|uniref:receptor-type tyrosine-protein phosphatase H isoform X3 n=1 Tax=Procambarus clarkii TaxID=6728 RepID=UPI00374441B1
MSARKWLSVMLLVVGPLTLTTAQLQPQDDEYKGNWRYQLVKCYKLPYIGSEETVSLNLSLSAGTEDISARWNEVPEASSYSITWTPEDNGGTATVNGSSNTQYSIKGLKACTDYTVTVQAINETDAGDSENANATTKAKGSLNLSLSADLDEIWVSWSPFPNATSYIITWSPEDNGGAACAGNVDSNYTISSLEMCTWYTVTVQAWDQDSHVLCSNSDSIRTDEDLLQLSLSAGTEDISARWNEVPEASSYSITWTPEDNGGTATVNGSSNSQYSIKGLKACTNYSVTVQAMKETGNVGCSETNTRITNIKELLDLSLSAGTESITAHWNEVPDASFYTITWTQVDNNGTDIVDVVNSTIYTIEGLMPCTVYRVTVQAMNDARNVGCLDTVKSRTKTNAPESFRAESIKTKKVTLSWSDANTECQALGYQLSYGTTVVNVSANTHQYTVTGLNAKKSYSFSLKTVTNSGESENVSLTISTKVDGVAIGVGVSVGVLVVVVAAVLGYIYRDKLRCSREGSKEFDHRTHLNLEPIAASTSRGVENDYPYYKHKKGTVMVLKDMICENPDEDSEEEIYTKFD